MARKPQDITDAELAVLEELWRLGGAGVPQLAEILYESNTASDLATVQKLLKRLEEKECVQRDRTTWPHRFEATIDRVELINRRLQAIANALCNGSLTMVLTQLVEGKKLRPKDRDQLRTLLDQPATAGAKPKKKAKNLTRSR